MLDMGVLASEIAAIVSEEVERNTAPIIAENKALRDRIDALEAANLVEMAVPTLSKMVEERLSALPAPKDGRDGTDVDMDAVQRMIGDAVAALPVPKDGRDGIDGKDGQSVDIAAVEALVAEAVSALPVPKDGLDGNDGRDGRDGNDGADVDMDAVKSLVADAVAALPAPKDGADADMDQVATLVREEVARSMATIPQPKDGRDGVNGNDGRDGNDGAGIADLIIDRTGNLVATFSDGRMKELGLIVGKDGRDGIDGKDGIPFSVEDLDMTLMDDGRTVRMGFTKGDTEYAFQIPFPIVLDRGVFSEGKAYEEGDGVTWGGSFWIAQRATGTKPDGPDSGWRLAVKRGRDGRDKA